MMTVFPDLVEHIARDAHADYLKMLGRATRMSLAICSWEMTGIPTPGS